MQDRLLQARSTPRGRYIISVACTSLAVTPSDAARLWDDPPAFFARFVAPPPDADEPDQAKENIHCITVFVHPVTHALEVCVGLPLQTFSQLTNAVFDSASGVGAAAGVAPLGESQWQPAGGPVLARTLSATLSSTSTFSAGSFETAAIRAVTRGVVFFATATMPTTTPTPISSHVQNRSTWDLPTWPRLFTVCRNDQEAIPRRSYRT
jgi:hypothetical protein